ncbi:MAG: hypothetical protein WBE29_01295, partial [Pseudolabrys sp.]
AVALGTSPARVIYRNEFSSTEKFTLQVLRAGTQCPLLGQKQTFAVQNVMSALLSCVLPCSRHVRFHRKRVCLAKGD